MRWFCSPQPQWSPHWPEPSCDSLPCTAAVRALGVPPRVLGRRKDRIVTAPEAGCRQAPRAQAGLAFSWSRRSPRYWQLPPALLVELHLNDRGTDPAAAIWRAIPAAAQPPCWSRHARQMILVDVGLEDPEHGRHPEAGHAARRPRCPPRRRVRRRRTRRWSSTCRRPIRARPSPSLQHAGLVRLHATSQWGCLDDLWYRESGWVYNAENASGAYGIPQALPGSKMASAGADWQTNPTTQIKWGLGYIKGRYGTPCDAWGFWQANGWY